MSQNDQILRFLRFGRRLTPLAALNLFGTNRLAARVLELKKRGHPIRVARREIGGKSFAEYYLEPSQPEKRNADTR